MKIKNTLILLLLLSVTLVACDGTPSSDWVTSEDGATSMPTTSNPFIEQPALYTLSFYTDGAGQLMTLVLKLVQRLLHPQNHLKLVLLLTDGTKIMLLGNRI